MKPHIPPELPVKIQYNDLIPAISKAQHELGNLSGSILHPGVNSNLLITPLLTKEAVLSSSIEGTVATVEEVFRYEADEESIKGEKIRRDAQEIVNYRKALEVSLEELNKRAIGENLLKKAHFILLDSVRGEGKGRGEFRRKQVFIGKPGSQIEGASFIPAPVDEIPRLMKNWETYINSQDERELLVQIAVAHYQFEAIHPFLDGNGRIGRLVIPLFLCDRDLLPRPILYVSEFFENHRDRYIQALRTVDKGIGWNQWISFFLEAIRVQSSRTRKSIMSIISLYEELKEEVTTFGSVYGNSMLDAIFIRPIVNYRYLKTELNASPQTIYNLIDKFVNAGILFQIPGRERNRLYIFPALLELLR
ncbi:MAG: Fic family protein [Anaerolineales bacterium]